MSKSKLFILCALLTFAAVSCTKDEDEVITLPSLPLKGTQQVPSNNTAGAGSISGSFNKSTGVLSYTISWNNLTGAHNGMHFHKAARGLNGPVVKNIQTSGSATGSITESWTVPDSLYTKLEQGGFYVNIHTDAYPDGEMRGQLEF